MIADLFCALKKKSKNLNKINFCLGNVGLSLCSSSTLYPKKCHGSLTVTTPFASNHPPTPCEPASIATAVMTFVISIV